ncbi:hypothetical protein ACOSQ3_030562 [Xanthoceras sorbifolium]
MGNCIGFQISCDKLLSGCQDYVVQRATYKRNLKKDLVTLRTELKKLVEIRNDVRREVDIAERQPDVQRLEQVGGWFSRVEAAEVEGDRILGVSYQEVDKLCLGGCLSKELFKSSSYGEEVKTLLQQVATLKAEGGDNFKRVAGKVPVDLVDERPGEETVIGQQSTCNRVWSCIEGGGGDEEQALRTIGLYGMGGVGKTTLLRQINNKLSETPKGFVVIWVLVSKDVNYDKIQEQVMKKIGTVDESWKDKSIEDKSVDILKILSRKKFVLLLDDVWNRVDLTKVGVPPRSRVASKIVFTTRSFDVCGLMEAERTFKVDCLKDDEAWKLFESKVGQDTLKDDAILELAADVVKECKGLPLALITVGRAMANKKTPQRWRHAVQLLKNSAAKFPGMEDEVFPLLKFSYDSLPDGKYRPCLLYCSLFSEDYKISRRSLVDCWIGEGFLEKASEAQNEGYHIIGFLLDACLLEEEQNDCVKMHDVIRDMALWIANDVEKEKENFFVKAGGGLIRAPEFGELKEVRRISLMENQIENLEEVPTCRNLLTLFLNSNHLKEINKDFFNCMSSLRVLNLSDNPYLTELSPGISKLSVLHHLDLSRTVIEELPEELEALEKLKCLNLEYTSQLRKLPRRMISKFPMLSVLRIQDCGSQSQAAEDSALFNDGEFLMEELLALENLYMLSISLKSSHALERFFSSRKLQSCTQSLCLRSLRHSKSIQVSLADMTNLETLDILDCKHLEECRIDCAATIPRIRGPRGFPSLEVITIRSCSRLRDLTWLVLAPNLKRIAISDCSAMEDIFRVGQLGEFQNMVGNQIPLSKLEFLELQDLKNLKSIYWSALPFPCLKEIKVMNCPKLNKLPLDSNSAKANQIVIMGHYDWWERLQWEDQAAQNAFHLSFKDLW